MIISRRRFIILLVLFIAIVLLAPFIFMLWMDRKYFYSKPYKRKEDRPTDVLVLYYSRSGNTEAMAREMARRFQADIIKLTSESYTLDFKGWINANLDAWNQNPAVIGPETIDISNYNLIILGSPIWYFRPAPPLWTFVEKNNFQGKAVVLFNTFNSRFKSEHIHEFQQLVNNRGGRFLDHVYVRRGRIFNQINGNELIKKTQELLNARNSKWRSIIGKIYETAFIYRTFF
jgi:flavodoxin